MEIIVAILVFAFGAIIGSFISALVHRLHNKKSIILARSICPKCNETLKPQHLIPILSFLFLSGRCAYCREKISYHYVAAELFTGLSFLIVFLNWNFLADPSNLEPFIFYLIQFFFLITIFFYDLKYKVIPDRISLPAIGAAIAGGLLLGLVSPLNMAIGAGILFLFFLFQIVISGGEWVGGGDLRMGILIGVLLGWELGLVALVISYVIGAILSLILIATKMANRKTAIPFAPFLVVGTIVALVYGQDLLSWYLGFWAI